MTTDLERVLGYQDAQNDDGDMVQVAENLLMMPFWTAEMCQAVINAAEAVGGFEPNPDDPVPGHEISLAVISPRLYENLMIDLGERIWPQLQQKWPLIDYCGLRDASSLNTVLMDRQICGFITMSLRCRPRSSSMIRMKVPNLIFRNSHSRIAMCQSVHFWLGHRW